MVEEGPLEDCVNKEIEKVPSVEEQIVAGRCTWQEASGEEDGGQKDGEGE